jgi:hypothetical protein
MTSTRVTRHTRAVYWTSTAIVCAVMAFSAINFNLEHPLGPMKGALAHLGFPDYFRIELPAAKTLGVAALLVPGVPATDRGFAYAGFAITLVSASIAHYATGDAIPFVLDPLLFLVVLAVSYVSSRRMRRGERVAERVAERPASRGETR